MQFNSKEELINYITSLDDDIIPTLILSKELESIKTIIIDIPQDNEGVDPLFVLKSDIVKETFDMIDIFNGHNIKFTKSNKNVLKVDEVIETGEFVKIKLNESWMTFPYVDKKINISIGYNGVEIYDVPFALSITENTTLKI